MRRCAPCPCRRFKRASESIYFQTYRGAELCHAPSSPNLAPLCGSARATGDVAWPKASWRPSAGCGWPIPRSAPSRCSLRGSCSPSCGSSGRTWTRATRRSATPRGAAGAEGGERGHGGRAAAAPPIAAPRRLLRARATRLPPRGPAVDGNKVFKFIPTSLDKNETRIVSALSRSPAVLPQSQSGGRK